MAAVLLRRLYTSTFEEFWPEFSPETQSSVKEQMLVSIQQEALPVMRRKMCECTAEFARNMLGARSRLSRTGLVDVSTLFSYLSKDFET